MQREAWRRRCRTDLTAWCIEALAPLGHKPARHHRLLIAKLEAVARGEIDRLMVFMPPRHAKSEYISKLFVPWYIARHPNSYVIAASHTYDLAVRFGRQARDLVVRYSDLLGIALRADTMAADRWNTTNGSGYVAAGVGKAIAGLPATLFIIDDPLPGRMEAESETTRGHIWDWYTSDVITRLHPGAAVILVMCMTGDTPVLMADGSERALREIRRGDVVATYEDGRITSSVVRNFANQGPDFVFAIKMKSGITVKANARHPFLVEQDGERKWLRTDALQGGMSIPRVITGDGAASLARKKDATSLPSVGAFACPITAKLDGRLGSGPRPLTQHLLESGIYGIATESTSPNMTPELSLKMAGALFVDNPQERTFGHIGAVSSALTTTMRRIVSEDFCATIATLRSGMGKQKKSYSPPPNTFEIILDQVDSITECGREDVFDIQVEGTENFIANGLVSHNTRWHEDDLAGHLLDQMAAGGDKWDILRLPAFAEAMDPMGRAPGDPLWPEWLSSDALNRIRAVETEYEWSALYQQDPRPRGGSFFTEAAFLVQGAPAPMPARCDTVFAVIDTAVKTGNGNDGTAVLYFAYDAMRHHVAAQSQTLPADRGVGEIPLYMLDWDYIQIEGASLETWLPGVFQTLEMYARACGARRGSIGAYIEDKASGMVLLQHAERNGWPAQPIESKLTSMGKVERGINASPYVQSGLVKITDTAYNKAVIYKGRSANHLMTQMLGFRVDSKDNAADDLFDTAMYGIMLALGGAGGF